MMENNNFNKKDNFTKDDFQLVQSNTIIHDLKLETKPTTFFKDAIRRFAKNKSSVVGAIILGILILLAIFVPMISTSNIKKTNTGEKFLAPKLFKTGTGFWDGTTKYTGIVYDTVNEVPADYVKDAVYKIINTYTQKTNAANSYGVGGYVMFETTDTQEVGKVFFLSSYPTTFTSNGEYTFTTHLEEVNGALGGELAEYALYLTYTDEITNQKQEILLKDWSREYGDIRVNISDRLENENIEKVKGTVTFKIKKGTDLKKKNYILIQNAYFDALEDVENYKYIKNDLSFTDATKMVLETKKINNESEENIKFWSCDGRKGVFESEITYCDFIYDTYAKAYGKEIVPYTKTELEEFINNGWCEYDYTIGPESFKLIDEEKCPIDSITSQQTSSITGKLLNVQAISYKYRKMGYDKMPMFIFGTDEYGHDIFKKAFAGLRTSLVLGVCTTAFCFLFGLCWGSISGYFGGNVDLAMERFCDILGGIPWIVVMTLCILHLGNNFFTFFLALCLTGWMSTAARTRTQFYRFKGREYILASRTLGASDGRLIFRHILPNSLGTIITSSVLMIPSVIFSEATLAYLNLGLQGVQSFGVMMAQNQQYIDKYPNLVIFPAVIIALMMISFNLFGNGLRDAFNPSLKGSE